MKSNRDDRGNNDLKQGNTLRLFPIESADEQVGTFNPETGSLHQRREGVPSRQELEWGGPVKLGIVGGPTQFEIVITREEWGRRAIVPTFRINRKELDQLLQLFVRHIDSWRGVPEDQRSRGQRPNQRSCRIAFMMRRNEKGKNLGAYSLEIVGRGIDTIMPMNRGELFNFIGQVCLVKHGRRKRNLTYRNL